MHKSVLLNECIEYLNPVPGGLYVDGTMGLAGHSCEILRKSAPDGKLIAFEWDKNAIALSKSKLKEFEGRFQILRRNFSEIHDGLKEVGVDSVDGILIDIGLSSLQLDQGGRGFSFRFDEPLDMRMDDRKNLMAKDLIAYKSKEELADIFFYYGEERQARRIAAEIVGVRKKTRIDTSKQLAQIVSQAVPIRFHPKKIHVATKVFQALRICVNTELENLSRIIDDGVHFLKPGARFCIITFHSLEDRLVKRKFNENHLLDVVTKKPIIPGKSELTENPRARSAKLRVAVRNVN